MKYYGKEKCKILKQIRAEIAKQNDIEWVVSECQHQGNCRGTCPKCEAEVRELEAALARREALGKTVAVVGISAGLALSVSGCANPLPLDSNPLPSPSGNGAVTETATSQGEVLVGEMLPPETVTYKADTETLEEQPPLPGEVALPDETDETDETDGTEPSESDVLMGDPIEGGAP